jgi:hypothetical protein
MTTDVDRLEGRRSGGGMLWFWAAVLLIVFIGAAFSVAAYSHAEPQLTVIESIGAGFAGAAALIIGIFGAAVAAVVGLVGALIGVVAAGGAVAMTLFIVGSPLIAIILLVLLLRRPKSACPDPGAH